MQRGAAGGDGPRAALPPHAAATAHPAAGGAPPPPQLWCCPPRSRPQTRGGRQRGTEARGLGPAARRRCPRRRQRSVALRGAFADSRLPGACGRLAGHGRLPLGRRAGRCCGRRRSSLRDGERSPARRAEADVYGRDEPGAPAEPGSSSGLPAQGEAYVCGQPWAGSTQLLPTHPGTGRATQHPSRPGGAQAMLPGQKAAGCRDSTS